MTREENTECSFDLTEFGSDGDKWQTICDDLELSDRGQVSKEYGEDYEHGTGPFVWRCRRGNLTVLTYNHPVTGAYHDRDVRRDQAGYASYIGAFGDADLVTAFRALVRIHATYIKDVNPTKRQYA